MLQKWSSNYHSKCQDTLWTIINFPSGFVTLDSAGKNEPKSFLHWEVCLPFQKNCVFNKLLGVTEMVFKLPQYLSEYLVNPYELSLGVWHTRWCEKKRGQTFFFPGNFAFYSKKCVFNNLLGVTDMILQLPQQLSKYLVYLVNCRLRLTTLDSARKSWLNSFLQWTDCL